jgi:hypothetical protein
MFGLPCILACDAQCHKAWGSDSRPSIQLSDNEDDYAYLADHELGFAPKNPGTYVGDDEGKPITPEERLNRWCARECERANVAYPGKVVKLPNFDKRIYNIPASDPENT